MTVRRLHCLCAEGPELQPTLLAEGLPAQHCDRCGSTALRLNDYRAWRNRHPDAELPSAVAGAAPEDESAAGARACRACSRMMLRHRVGTDPDFWIDRCWACQWVWFDRNEWTALAGAGLALKLPELLSEAWQRQLRDNDLRERREKALREKHGDTCVDELARMREWLDAQPQREELLNLLRTGW